MPDTTPSIERPGDEGERLASRLGQVGRSFEAAFSTPNLPVHRTSTVLFDSLAAADAAGRAAAAGEHHASSYGTSGTPSTFALMDALASIEGRGHECRAALMPSGLAAISIALLAFLKPGDHLLMVDSVYGPTRGFVSTTLARMGIETSFFAADLPVRNTQAAGQEPAASGQRSLESLLRPETRMIYLESPGSYTFEIQDVPAICRLARERGLLTVIDNAWASPIFANPFDWGVDASILPLTKYWGGHGDVLMGAVVVRKELWPTLWSSVRQFGLCVGGDDAWLVLRGLRTVDVRMRQHQRSAMAVATWLARHPEVARVLYPALPDSPGHDLWQRDFSGASGLLSFELTAQPEGRSPTPARLAALCEGRRHFGIGYSWGGFESLIMPARLSGLRTAGPWSGGQLIRLHVGLQDPDDLIADLARGFDAMARA